MTADYSRYQIKRSEARMAVWSSAEQSEVLIVSCEEVSHASLLYMLLLLQTPLTTLLATNHQTTTKVSLSPICSYNTLLRWVDNDFVTGRIEVSVKDQQSGSGTLKLSIPTSKCCIEQTPQLICCVVLMTDAHLVSPIGDRPKWEAAQARLS